MTREEYEIWKERRKDIDVDAGFTDRVMERIIAEKPQPPGDTPYSIADKQSDGRRAWDIPAVSALLLVSLTAGMLRYGLVFVLVFVFLSLMSSKGY